MSLDTPEGVATVYLVLLAALYGLRQWDRWKQAREKEFVVRVKR